MMAKKENLILPQCKFEKILISILARDEVISLRETVESIAAIFPPEDVDIILMYLAPDATEECKAEAKRLESEIKNMPIIRVLQQTWDPIYEMHPFGISREKASHVLFLAADLEIKPEAALQMLQACKANPNALISLTRWREGGGFTGYPKWQLPIHWFFQQVVRIMYGARMSTDATAGYSAIPKHIGLGLILKEKRQSVFLEYKLCLLRLGLPLVEIPVQYRARREGKSTGSFWHKVRYIVPLIRVRFTSRKNIYHLGGNVNE